MRVTILTVGSRGDVQPYVALGVGMQNAGHAVRLATHAAFETLVRSRGLDFFPIAGDPRGTLEGEAGRDWLDTGQNPFVFMRRMITTARPFAWQVADDYWKACQDTDFTIYPNLAALLVASITEKIDVPAYPAYLQHVHPTRDYPSALAMPIPNLGGLYNQLTYPVGSQIFWQFMRPLVNEWRRQTLDLPPYPGSPFGAWLRERRPTMYGFSPTVVPKPQEWGAEVHVTGYWFLDKLDDWQPPAELVAFLESGPPPVFVGFGSMTNRNPEEMTHLVVEALAQSGQRGLMLTGWGGLSQTDLPESVFQIESAPFDWLFPRMAVVVHHGGTGTTAEGLRAGIPTITVPFFGDQHFWAWRVTQLGAGPRPIPRKNFSAERLATAIKEAASSEAIRSRAAQVGRQIRSEEGVTEAVHVLNLYLAER